MSRHRSAATRASFSILAAVLLASLTGCSLLHNTPPPEPPELPVELPDQLL